MKSKINIYSTQLSFCYVTHTHTHTNTHTHTHQNTVMKVARCSIATVQYFCTVNAANIFPTSQFLFDFNLIKLESDIAVSTSVRMGSIIEHRPTLCCCSFCTLHIEPK